MTFGRYGDRPDGCAMGNAGTPVSQARISLGLAKGGGTKVIKIAVRAPNMNAIAERFVGSGRCELLDHVILLGDRHLDSLVREYKVYFNEARPHQGIGQRVPSGIRHHDLSKPIVIRSVLGGLHADYRRAA